MASNRRPGKSPLSAQRLEEMIEKRPDLFDPPAIDPSFCAPPAASVTRLHLDQVYSIDPSEVPEIIRPRARITRERSKAEQVREVPSMGLSANDN